MAEQTGYQKESPIPNKMMNCNDWATYIPPDASEPERALCHGGRYDGESYLACPTRDECKRATLERRYTLVNPRALMQQQQARPINSQMAPTGTTAAQTVSQYGLRPLQERDLATQLPRAREARDAREAQSQPQAAYERPRVVTPPRDAPPGMRTPYAMPFPGPTETPTFIPSGGESTFDRLLLNILQGMLGSFGYQIWRFCQTIDLFG